MMILVESFKTSMLGGRPFTSSMTLAINRVDSSTGKPIAATSTHIVSTPEMSGGADCLKA
jgi:hypothetical protein